MANPDPTAADELTAAVLTGDTHLEASYRPEWANSNPDWDDGQILLEGELDFPADQPASGVARNLRARSEEIGAIVSHDTDAGQIRAYPWNGPGHFRLDYDPDDPTARVESITVFDGQDRPASHETVDELKAQGEAMAEVVDAITPDADAGADRS